MSNEHVNQYAERDAMQLDKDGGYYSRHIQSMTREGLHSKGDIAAELAWRDQQIDQLKADLEERRKADSDPVGEFYEDGTLNWYQISDGDRVPANRRIPLYRHAQPVPERERIRREHAEWSDATFGDVGPIGPLKHLSKEALEAAADPSDPLEWADMQFLLWDAQRRMGLSDEFITRAMIEKLAINKARQWPEPKDGEPRLHIKAQPAPVVPEEMPKGLAGQIVSLLAHNIGDKLLAQKIWNVCRAAMLQSKYRDLSQPVDPQISEYEKIMLRAGNSPAVRFDNRYITTRLEVFEDTYEIIAWLERMANECCDPDDKYGLKEAATSLRGMYADLKEFGGALMQIQGKSGPEAEK